MIIKLAIPIFCSWGWAAWALTLWGVRVNDVVLVTEPNSLILALELILSIIIATTSLAYAIIRVIRLVREADKGRLVKKSHTESKDSGETTIADKQANRRTQQTAKTVTRRNEVTKE